MSERVTHDPGWPEGTVAWTRGGGCYVRLDDARVWRSVTDADVHMPASIIWQSAKTVVYPDGRVALMRVRPLRRPPSTERWDHATLDELVRRRNGFTRSWHEEITAMKAETDE